MFPSLTLRSEDEPDLNNPMEFRVPVPKNSSLNLNPRSYYKDSSIMLHKYGIVDSRYRNDNDCHLRTKPPKLVPTVKTRWTTNSSMHMLGNFDLDAAYESFVNPNADNGDVNLAQLASTNKSLLTLSAGNLDYVNAIPQLMEESRFPRNENESKLSPEELQALHQSEYDDTCELSQCSWLPANNQYLDSNDDSHNFESFRNSIDTCFLAELRAKYVLALKDYCDSTTSAEQAANVHCETLQSRSEASNPGSLIPEYCYAAIDTQPNTTSPDVDDPAECDQHPFIMTYEFIKSLPNINKDYPKELKKFYNDNPYDEKHLWTKRRVYDKPACNTYNESLIRIKFDGTDSCFDNNCDYLPTNAFADNKWYSEPGQWAHDNILPNEGLRKCTEKENNFQNMSDIYFRWPLAMGTCLKFRIMKDGLYNNNGHANGGGFFGYIQQPYIKRQLRNSNPGECGASQLNCVPVRNLPIITTPRVLPRFRCGSKEAATEFADFYNLKHQKNLNDGKIKYNNRNFRNCYSHWKELTPNAKAYKDSKSFLTMLDCLLDNGLARYIDDLGIDKDSDKDGIDENVRLFLLSILTHLNPNSQTHCLIL